MLEQSVRKTYQKILVDPLARLLFKFPFFTANRITLAALIFGLLSAGSLYFDWRVIAIIFLLLSGYCDTLDGTFARLTNTASNRGSVLDIVTDRLVEFFMVLGLYAVEPAMRATASLWLLGGFMICITSFLVVGIFTPADSEKSFYYSPGLIERAEAFFFFVLMIVFPSCFNWLAFILIVLVFYTAAVRVWQFYHQQTEEK